MYEPQLERRDVAIRGMYRMWHGKQVLRQELLDLGLTQAQGDLAFQNQPFPRTEKQVFELIQRCPEVMPVAERLLAQYIWTEGDTRKDYYRKKQDETVLRGSDE